MNMFSYIKDELHIENCKLVNLAKNCRTPFYAYSLKALRASYKQFEKFAGKRAEICYAVKANSNQAVLAALGLEGSGADIVSMGEGKRAIAAGIPPQKIFFSGAGKSDEELCFALEMGLGQINVESINEFERLARIATKLGKIANIALRINPDIAAGGHDKISTGKAGDKFGMSLEKAEKLYIRASADKNFEVKSLAIHIGSQIFDLEIFNKAWHILGKLALSLRAQNLKVDRLDLGGGLGISLQRALFSDIENYSKAAALIGEKYDCDIVLSPGRAICGQAGVLVASVIEVKSAGLKHFLILDSAMNDLLRPTLYGVNHFVWTVQASDETKIKYQLVGPICESGDVLGRDIELPQQNAGNLIAIMEAGAYGAVLSSYYNSRLLVPEIMVDDEKFSVVRKRLEYKDLIAMDEVPEWIKR